MYFKRLFGDGFQKWVLSWAYWTNKASSAEYSEGNQFPNIKPNEMRNIISSTPTAGIIIFKRLRLIPTLCKFFFYTLLKHRKFISQVKVYKFIFKIMIHLL